MKFCECGCGQAAPISKLNRPERGYMKGEAQRFINGHNSHRHTEEARGRIAEAGRGRKPNAETRARLSASKSGERNPAWKGGTHTRRRRRQIFVGVTHPMANSNGYVFEHRLVMAGVLGRSLRSDEHVHHIDLDSLNNAPENLILLTPSQHSRLHRLIDKAACPPLVALAVVTGTVEEVTA